jgi:hypothetical protein
MVGWSEEYVNLQGVRFLGALKYKDIFSSGAINMKEGGLRTHPSTGQPK